MNKAQKIAEFIEKQEVISFLPLDPHYLGYFTCFNRKQYYEAHDVLEQLWLKTAGADHLFYKGLIQLAGALVHLQKQFQDPGHRVHGKRLGPAMRLFRLSEKNLAPYRPFHLHCNTDTLCKLASRLAFSIENSGQQKNPWDPERPPQIQLQEEDSTDSIYRS